MVGGEPGAGTKNDSNEHSSLVKEASEATSEEPKTKETPSAKPLPFTNFFRTKFNNLLPTKVYQDRLTPAPSYADSEMPRKPSNAGSGTTTDRLQTPKPALLAEQEPQNPLASGNDQGNGRHGGRGTITKRVSYEDLLAWKSVLLEKNTDLERQLTESKKNALHWSDAAASYEKEYAILYSNYSNMLKEQDRHAETVRRVQENAFRHFGSAEWMPESNEDIRQKLKTLDNDIKKWSKDYAISSLQSIPLNSAERKTLIDCLTCFVKLEKDEIVVTDETLKRYEIPKEVSDDRAWMLLHGYIMQKLYADVFELPFFAFGERYLQIQKGHLRGHRHSSITQDLIQKLYDEFTRNDYRESFAWRVQTLRLLNPPLRDDEQDSKSSIHMTRRATEEALVDAAHNLCRRYLRSSWKSGVNPSLQKITPELNRGVNPTKATPELNYCMNPLLKTVPELTSKFHEVMEDAVVGDTMMEDTVMEDTLHPMILRAAKISFSLWTQKNDLECKYIDELPTKFSYDHPWLEAHPLHSSYLDEDPALLDGMPILVVAHPALIRYGTGDGLDYGVPTVLKRAVCWMGDPSGRK